MLKIILLLALVTTASSTQAEDRTEDWNLIKETNQQFMIEAQARGVRIPNATLYYGFVRKNDDKIAVCYLGAQSKRIIINLTQWDRLSLLKKIMVIMHENGHCLLYRGHSENKSSIMYKYGLADDIFFHQYKKVMDELFDKRYIFELLRTKKVQNTQEEFP
jgi:hypothetical protein